MNRTEIAWTDRSWNPVRGCSRVSPGCQHCYAERMAARFSDRGELEDPGVWLRKPGWGYGFAEMTKAGPRWTGRVELVPEKLDELLRLRKPQRIFVNSTSDLFHEALPDYDIVRVLDVIRQNECRDYPHTMQVLTKRPERMLSIMSRLQFDASGAGRMWLEDRGKARDGVPIGIARIFRHLWLGVSVEDQKTADERIPLLLQTPAAVRFVSYEPALGPVDLHFRCVLHPRQCDEHRDYHERRPLHWVIVGGESGPGARPCNVSWIRSVVQQCREAGVACFVKQMGTQWAREQSPTESIYHYGAGTEPAYWPEDLRVQEFPC